MSDAASSFDAFVASLTRISAVARSSVSTTTPRAFEEAAAALKALAPIDRDAIEAMAIAHPDWIPILASIVGLSLEQLKRVLRHRLGTESWSRAVRERPRDLVALLDQEYGLLDRIAAERERPWSYADILLERTASRRRATRAIGHGRQLEDEVEAVASSLGLTFRARTRFVGRAAREAPCDLAIPAGGDEALIVCAVKGFDSTGSKLTDALREIESMAEARDARQFVYAVVDGIGWLSRQADLRRIHALAANRSINGLFSRAQLETFRAELGRAARIHGLLS